MVTICKNVKALDALGHQILCVLNDLFIRALEDARAAGNLADERQICHAVFFQKLCYGVIVYCAHQVIKAAVDRRLCAVEAACLVIGHYLEERGLACCLHCSGYLLHLVLRQADILEAPELYRQILALLKYLACVLHGHIVMCQHYYDLRFHFFFVSL